MPTTATCNSRQLGELVSKAERLSIEITDPQTMKASESFTMCCVALSRGDAWWRLFKSIELKSNRMPAGRKWRTGRTLLLVPARMHRSSAHPRAKLVPNRISSMTDACRWRAVALVFASRVPQARLNPPMKRRRRALSRRRNCFRPSRSTQIRATVSAISGGRARSSSCQSSSGTPK